MTLRMFRTVSAASATAIAASLLIATPAQASGHESSLRVVLGDPQLTTNSDGTPLAVEERSDEFGESVIRGTTASGEVFTVTTTYGIPATASDVAPPAGDELYTAPVDESADGAVVEIGQADLDGAVDEDEFEPLTTVGHTPMSIAIAWAPVAQAQQYVVDAAGLTSTSDTSVSFSREQLSQVEHVTIDAVDASGASLHTRIIPLLTAPTAARTGEMGVMTYQPYTTAFTYETFIAESRAQLNWAEGTTCGGWPWEQVSFGGDNRSYRTPGFDWPYDEPDYRSMVMAVINWTQPAESSVILGKGVGATSLYVNGAFKEQKTASATGIQTSNAYRSGSYAQVTWNHDVGNPFCSVGSIAYNITARFYRSGTIEVVGWRRPVPNHESYGRWNNTGLDFWGTPTRTSNEGFGCLVPNACPNRTINVSATR